MTTSRIPQRSTLALTIALALSGCGGGGGDSAPAIPTSAPPPPPTGTVLNGVVTDGYVSGATVYVDLNNNNTKDANEPSALTDASGKHTLNASLTAAQLNGQRLRVLGGTDNSTGQPFTHSMSGLVEDAASKPFVPVSPLSSIVEGMVASGAASSPAQARENVARVLGLSSGAALDKDPLTIAGTEKPLLQKMVALQK
ncbi:MAG TPA: hypothetical protein VNT33_14330, partial [Telluria sp.]|nr:hypothetical protein [Telluria sp.]